MPRGRFHAQGGQRPMEARLRSCLDNSRCAEGVFPRPLKLEPTSRWTEIAFLYPFEKDLRQPGFAWIVRAVLGAKIQKLLAEWVMLARLSQNLLNRTRQFTEAVSLASSSTSWPRQDNRMSEITPSDHANTGPNMKRASRGRRHPEFRVVQFESYSACSFRSLSHLPCIAASTSSAVCGSAATRSMSLPSAPTRKTHSMRTPIFSSGM